MRLQALQDLCRRYWQIFNAAWSVRKDLAVSDRNQHERAFLPAALEIQESPPHPAAHIALWSLIVFLIIALVWSIFGKIDVVAVAPGKLVVSDRSKVVQPLEPGMVKAIHVQDGQFVKAGQLLVELDTTITGADSDKNSAAWLDAKIETLRAQALLQALESRRPPELRADSELPENNPAYRVKLSDAQRLALSQWQELQAKLATVDADSERKRAERAGTLEQVHKLEQTLPIITKRATDYKDLWEKKFVAKHSYLEKEQARIETERDLATQGRKLEELSEGLTINQRQKESSIAEFRRTEHDLLAKARERSRELAQEVVKAKRHNFQTRLTAPVSGTVQQLAIHTVGGVVTAAQALLVIVPQEDIVEAEAMLENKDIGFINAGQDAAVKVETFNYTKYGLIDGKVQSVSLDAIQDEKRGLIYATRIRIKKNTMLVEGRTVRLTPGMAVTVEIKTAQRRIIEYFLSPLIQHVSESIRER
jgi:hemolysin D